MDTVRSFKDIAKTRLRGLRGDDQGTGHSLQQVQHQVSIDAGYRSWGALLDATDADRELALMDREPQLNQFGLGPGSFARTLQERRENVASWRKEFRASAKHVDEVRSWLVDKVEPRETINTSAGSYGLKLFVGDEGTTGVGKEHRRPRRLVRPARTVFRGLRSSSGGDSREPNGHRRGVFTGPGARWPNVPPNVPAIARREKLARWHENPDESSFLGAHGSRNVYRLFSAAFNRRYRLLAISPAISMKI